MQKFKVARNHRDWPRPLVREHKILKRKFRNIDADLDDLFSNIESRGPDKIARSRLIVVSDSTNEYRLWRFRCRSRDQKKGGSGGFRIIMLECSGRLVPLSILQKSGQRSYLKSNDVLKRIEQQMHIIEWFSPFCCHDFASLENFKNNILGFLSDETKSHLGIVVLCVLVYQHLYYHNYVRVVRIEYRLGFYIDWAPIQLH